MAAIVAPPPQLPISLDYVDEPKIYISSATLQLRVPEPQSDYEWHTEVVPVAAAATPATPAAPITPIKEVKEPEVQAVTKKRVETATTKKTNRTFYTPLKMYGDETYSRLMTICNFMDAERYHSAKNRMATHKPASNRGSDEQSTNI